MRTTWGSATDRGRVRALNEDALLAHPPVFLVADGMGGHEAGDVASRLAVQEFAQTAGLTSVDPSDLQSCFQRAAARIRDTFERREGGTTVAGVALAERDAVAHWLVFNIGDSRVYRWSAENRELSQISVDHSVVQELMDAGRLSPAQAQQHPERHVLTRALGTGSEPEPDYWLLPAQAGDRVLLCSDGLTNELTADQIAAVLADGADAAETAATLVRLAVQAGGRDNTTVVVVDAHADPQLTLGWLALTAATPSGQWDDSVDGATIPRPRAHLEDQ